MAAVTVTNVRVGNNPAPFASPLVFDIQYQCHYSLKEDLEFKLLYVGSAESQQYDQTLDSVLVGPVQPGSFQFTFEADPPRANDIPPDDVVGVTVILLTCSYKDKEFIRIGYYVNNEYTEPELQELPPDNPIIEKLQRNILANKPRVTRFPHPFDQPELVPQNPVEQAAGPPGQAYDTNPSGPQDMVKAMQQEIMHHQQAQQQQQQQQQMAMQMQMQQQMQIQMQQQQQMQMQMQMQQQQQQQHMMQPGVPGWTQPGDPAMPAGLATGDTAMNM